jgi:uncharacterized protein (TIGR02246 family)
MTDDAAAITDVVARYGRGLDQRDFAGVAACFTADARASYGGVALEPGVEAIVAHVRRVEQLDATTHLFGIPVIEVDGDGAHAEVAATAILAAAGKVTVRGLRYRHRLVRSDGRWQIAELLHTVHWAFEAPASDLS